MDAISRRAAIDAIDTIESEIANGEGFQYEKWRRFFVEMPSVNQGHEEVEGVREIKTGDRIASLLLKRGMSQKELAKAIKMTGASVSRYINNEREPKATVLVKIAKTLDVSLDELLGLTSTKPEITHCKGCRHYGIYNQSPEINGCHCYWRNTLLPDGRE